jgi:hypothetical protein
VDLIRLEDFPWLILQPLVASTKIFYEFPHEPLALLLQQFYCKKLFSNLRLGKICKQLLTHSLDRNHHENSGYKPLFPQIFSVETPLWMGLWATTCCCLRPFLVGIPSWMGFLGHNLLLSQAFFGGNPYMDGILGHNLLFSQAFFGGNPFVDGILGHNLFLSQSSFIYSFMNFFLFSRWNSGYHEAFLTNFFHFND